MMTFKSLPPIVTSVHGNENHDETIVFIHGWPDDEHLWDLQVGRLSRDYKCLTFTLPWFGDSETAKLNASKFNYSPWGYSFEDIADMLYASIVQHCESKVIVVGHDWGAVYAEYLQARHPEIVSKMIILDVGGFKINSPVSLLHIPWYGLQGLAYQYSLIVAFLTGGITGKFIASMYSWIAKQEVLIRAQHRYRSFYAKKHATILPESGYPYYYHHKDFLMQLFGFKRAPTSNVRCPTLFIHGGNKLIPFHDVTWGNSLNEYEDSGITSVPCGHWLPIERADDTTSCIESYLKTPEIFLRKIKLQSKI